MIDPPRAGLSQKIVRRVLECEAQKIVYVSCNPTTLAPNAAQLTEAGYKLTRVRPVDMFPQTPHIECVALFEKAAGGRGFGVAAGLDPEVARPLAARCAELGYGSIWSNDHPGAKGLETLAEFAAAAPAVDLGVAVIALDRTPPETIAADIERLGIDPARLWLGVGAGFSKKPLTRMRESLPQLREALPGVRLVLAAMGPKMCALAGAEFDGVFFNWMTPEFAAGAREQVEAGAARGRPPRPAGLRLRPHRRRPRRRRAPGQGGVLLPRPAQGLPQPLRPPRRARGQRRRRRRETRPRRSPNSAPTRPSTPSSSAASPAPGSSR